jgi:integrase
MSRRAAGDGTLFKRSDGYWVGGIELPPGPDGKRRLKRVVRKNRNDCMAALRKVRADLEAGRITTAKTTTVEKWLTYWQDDILPHRNVKPGTASSYRTTIKLHIVPHIGAKRLDRLHPADIRGLYTLLQDTVSGREAQKAHTVLSLAIKAAVRDGLLGSNVMSLVDKPAHIGEPGVAFTAQRSMHIIETAVKTQGDMWGARWALGFTTGCRESELLGLEWDRVDLDNNLLDISWQLHRQQKTHGCGKAAAGVFPCGMVKSSYCPGAHWKFPPGMLWRECRGTLVWTRPKTRAGVRIVPLIPQMADVLRTIKASDGPNPHNLVFHHPDGAPFTQEQDQKAWKRLLIDADIPHVRQHTVRHSTATLLLEAGADAHVIQSVIGHTDVATTRGYQHVNMELARRAWGNLGQVMPVTKSLTPKHE